VPSAPRISAVVPTRNRAEHIVECVRSLLANDGLPEVVVVDQSDDDAAQAALAPLAGPRLRYVRSRTVGVCQARNEGIAAASGDVIAFTDDDCRVPTDWHRSIVEVLEREPAAAVVCGRVRVAPQVVGLGFTESFEPRQRLWKDRFPPFGSDWGITGNMAVRCSTFAQVGTFDPMLGAGGPLRSGGEPDLLYRVLRAGLLVVNASEVVVDHLGVRPFGPPATELLRRYGYGTAAALFKHVRLRDLRAFALFARYTASVGARVAGNLLRGKRPSGAGFFLGYLSGALGSYAFRVNRTSRLYDYR
jgi:glycosyltransferase involved in cell wall biosynthesis